MAMPASGPPDPDPQDPRSSRSPWASERGAAEARRRWRRKRRQQWTMGFMAGLTVLALLVIAGFVKEISRMPAQAQAAALTATTHSAAPAPSPRPKTKPKTKPSPSPSPSVSATTGPQITDAASGLSYPLLSQPWQQGCPGVLDTAVFSWSAGEHAVAGPADIGGTVVDWHGNACSGQLQQAFAYSGPADLEPVATAVADATGPVFYAGLTNNRTLQGSSAAQVSGHPAWVIRFLVSYPDAAAEGLAWTTEAAAVVVVDRGAGQAPAVFYASVPSNLGTGTVTTLINSLHLT